MLVDQALTNVPLAALYRKALVTTVVFQPKVELPQDLPNPTQFPQDGTPGTEKFITKLFNGKSAFRRQAAPKQGIDPGRILFSNVETPIIENT